jgi:hypothetical protein
MAIQVMDQAVDKRREFIKDNQTVVTEAVEAGRTAIQWKREAGWREQGVMAT